jgi:hypothetical protein
MFLVRPLVRRQEKAAYTRVYFLTEQTEQTEHHLLKLFPKEGVYGTVTERDGTNDSLY